MLEENNLTSGSAYTNEPKAAAVDVSPPDTVVRNKSREVVLIVR